MDGMKTEANIKKKRRKKKEEDVTCLIWPDITTPYSLIKVKPVSFSLQRILV